MEVKTQYIHFLIWCESHVSNFAPLPKKQMINWYWISLIYCKLEEQHTWLVSFQTI